MYLTDYHTHTRISPDSDAPLAVMAQAAVDAGLRELCVTDHVDLLGPFGEPLTEHSWADSLAQLDETLPLFEGRLTLRLGMELGVPHVNPALSERILNQPRLDFVIGSIHNQSAARGGQDFYYVDGQDLDDCYGALDDYFASMALLVECDYFDVLGHIIYPLRYMNPAVVLDAYWERIEAILCRAAERGRGIELNTYRGKTIAPWRPVLERFRACGGEIVTVGSDAHRPNSMGGGIPEACALLEACGFRYVATFAGRKPEFHKL